MPASAHAVTPSARQSRRRSRSRRRVRPGSTAAAAARAAAMALLGQEAVRRAGRSAGSRSRTAVLTTQRVSGVVHQEHLAPLAHRVQFRGGQVAAEGALVVADQVDPAAGRCVARRPARRRARTSSTRAYWGRCSACRAFSPVQARCTWLSMKPGQHGRALEVHHLAGGQCGDRLVQAHDPAPPDAELAGGGACRVHRDDTCVGQPGAEHKLILSCERVVIPLRNMLR